MQLKPTLDTKIEDFELHQKLHTRLVICRAKTFRDIMEINPEDWKGVNPKVVNALRRFQSQYRNIYRQLMAERESIPPADTQSIPAPTAKAPKSKNDERRFFVANNLLNAYAQAGLLTNGERDAADMMREIIETADAFMVEYEKDKESAPIPQQENEPTNMELADDIDDLEDTEDEVEEHDDEATAAEEAKIVEDMVPEIDDAIDEALNSDEIDEILIEEAAPVVAAADEVAKIEKLKLAQPMAKKGERITLTDYHGRNKSAAKTFKVGDTVTVKSMRKQQSGVIIVKAKFGNKEITIDSRRYGWIVEEEENKQPELNLLQNE